MGKGEADGALATPTLVGQTDHLVKQDGAVVARVCWDALPYYVRQTWGAREAEARDADVRRYLERDASPLALTLAGRSERLSDELKAVARARLDAAPPDPALVARLDKHFTRMLRRSRAKLLKHISVGDSADATLDRLDLLSEVIALRDVQHDLRAERSLVRAFRAMFATRDPFVLWLLVCGCLGFYFLLTRLEPAQAKSIQRQLVLLPNLDRPWTLATYGIVHVDWRHVILNMLSMLMVGHVLEQILGHLRFLGAFFVCAIGGGLASILYKSIAEIPFWTGGASGAISGLAGLALFLGLWFQARYGRIPLRYSTGTLVGGFVLVSNILMMASGGDVATDHGAHLGGLVVGVALGVAMRPALARRADARFGRVG